MWKHVKNRTKNSKLVVFNLKQQITWARRRGRKQSTRPLADKTPRPRSRLWSNTAYYYQHHVYHYHHLHHHESLLSRPTNPPHWSITIIFKNNNNNILKNILRQLPRKGLWFCPTACPTEIHLPVAGEQLEREYLWLLVRQSPWFPVHLLLCLLRHLNQPLTAEPKYTKSLC